MRDDDKFKGLMKPKLEMSVSEIPGRLRRRPLPLRQSNKGPLIGADCVAAADGNRYSELRNQ